MENYRIWKEGLSVLGEKLLDLGKQYAENGGREENPAENGSLWSGDIREILRQLREETLRVAVVGAIKSGKSTLINAWMGGDLLKRGAGVVTSIVTRVRRGESQAARVRFKNWDEVNADIEGALALFPASGWRQVDARFDIRRDRDREDLAAALKTLGTDQLVTEDARNIHSVYLYSYLEGYESVRSYITSDTPEAVFTGTCFADYQLFVADEIRAAYVRDILITMDTARMPDGIELADCQGSDAPNPLHIAQVQEYLFKTHLIIYVVSSRTGLRQADLRFLNMIRKMGILDSVIFVLNTDFGEHENDADVLRVTRKVESELGLLCPGARVHVFSALYRLLQTLGVEGTLPEKERLRLAQWEADPAMTAESRRAFGAFDEALNLRMTQDRARLLLFNQTARLRQIAASMANRFRMDRDLLGGDQEQARSILEEVRSRHQRVSQVQGLIRNTLDGSYAALEKELKSRTDRFFDGGTGEILPGILAFIREYRPDMDGYVEMIEKSGFSMALYHAFQDFRQALDTHMTDRVNPEIVRFVRELEDYMQIHYAEVARPYAAMVEEVLEEYCHGLKGMGVSLDLPSSLDTGLSQVQPRVQAERAGLHLPPAHAITRYNIKVRTEGHMRFGFYSFKSWVKGLFFKKKQEDEGGVLPGREGAKALAASLRRICRETEKQVLTHMVDYRENIKFQYILKLSSVMALAVQAELNARFSTCVTEMAFLDQTAARRGGFREERLTLIRDMLEGLLVLDRELVRLQEDMGKMRSAMG